MERRAIAIQGIVQGVGFRPFVYALASRLALRGFVKNRTGEVLIEIEGEAPSLDDFLSELACNAPPLAHIEHLSWQKQPLQGERLFRIEASDTPATAAIFVSADTATCADCCAELFDPADRRYRYPFLNCTHCGPRLTIITAAPYDRERTTMTSFPMCAACRTEYEDPSNRRFHAQPTACPACGPQLELMNPRGDRLATGDPLTCLVGALSEGKIAALKGLGGYHLACDARRPEAVSELRRRKHRDEKPFAIMVADISAAEELCRVNPAERELLQSRRRPIVLLRQRHSNGIAHAVAPNNPYLGVMLPYTPLHHLLLHELKGMPLVMTSGNRSDEPIASTQQEALHRLGDIADLFLAHNRPIHIRCDDSVTRVVDGLELPLRRSRGYAPQPILLPLACPRPILAVGGQFKGAFALGRDRHAFLSHHQGDLDHYDAYQAFVRDILLYQQLFDIRPHCIAHDLHPDYASTRYAIQRAAQEHEFPLDLVAVQHHHAHMASCMAEHGLCEPVIGVTFDGTGYGSDGSIWGGEFLWGDYRRFHRAAHLRYVGLPGGDRAIHEPWRTALAHLLDAGADDRLLRGRVPALVLRTVHQMLERRCQTPLTSSAGRLFDAVATLAGARTQVSFEGQAAMELEWLATALEPEGTYPFDLMEPAGTAPSTAPLQIDTRPLIRAVARDVSLGASAARIGRRFHSTLVEAIAAVCARLRAATTLNKVVLSGGVFMNGLLTQEVCARLRAADFQVFRHVRVPPNDGGLCLGQLAIAGHSRPEATAQAPAAMPGCPSMNR